MWFGVLSVHSLMVMFTRPSPNKRQRQPNMPELPRNNSEDQTAGLTEYQKFNVIISIDMLFFNGSLIFACLFKLALK